MDQQPAPRQGGSGRRNERYQPTVNDQDQFVEAYRNEHDDRDVWRPRRTYGGSGRYEDTPYQGHKRSREWSERREPGFDRGFDRGYDRRGQLNHRDGRAGAAAYHPSDQFREDGTRAHSECQPGHSDPREHTRHRPRSRERSPYARAHRDGQRSRQGDRHEVLAPDARAPAGGKPGEHLGATGSSDPARSHHQGSAGQQPEASGPPSSAPPIRAGEGARRSQFDVHPPHAAVPQGEAAPLGPGPSTNGNRWGGQQERGRRRPDPFAGAGKWKHDLFEQIDKQDDAKAAAPPVAATQQ